MSLERGIEGGLRTLGQQYDQSTLKNDEQVLVRQRIDATVASHGRSRALRWVLSFVITAGAATAVFIVMNRSWFSVIEGQRCVVAKTDGAVLGTSACGATVELSDAGARIELAPATKMTRVGHGVLFTQGRARFMVEKRSTRAPAFEVRVAAGLISVHGTTFTIEQAEAGGRVELFEGSIELRWDSDGQVTHLRPGDVVTWPRTTAGAQTTDETLKIEKAPRSLKDRSKKRVQDDELELDPNLRDVLLRLFQLKSQRRAPEAAALLRSELAKPGLTKIQRERLSYELGVVIEEELGQADEACRHWRKHAAANPRGLRSAAVRERLKACGEDLR
jgi:transmembrane sensor